MESVLSCAELLSHIFSFLNFSSIKRVRRVSRFWKQQSEYFKFWKNVELKLYDYERVEVSDELLNIISTIKICDVRNWKGDEELAWFFNQTFSISNPKTNLRQIPNYRVQQTKSNVSKKILSIIPRLNILKMELCQFSSYQLTSIFQHITNLELLILDNDLKDVPGDLLALSLTKVKRVNLEYANLSTEQLTLIYQEILSSSNSILENIKIDFSDHTNVETELLISAFSKLKQVRIYTCRINFEQLMFILIDRRLDSLEYLSLFAYPWDIEKIPSYVKFRERNKMKFFWCHYSVVITSPSNFENYGLLN